MSDGIVVVTSVNTNGDYIVATAEGVRIKDQWTYAIQTLDGMSGAPITNENGRVIGVHLSNTGFTGGGAVLTPGDLHEESEVEKLKKEIEMLRSEKKPTDQCITSDIVNLVREAVRNEMMVLRAELDSPFEQAKGKTKRKARLAVGVRARRGKRTKAWTEEEYKQLQEQGYTREQLQDMANNILEQMNDEDPVDHMEDEYGYPDWDDVDDAEREDIEKEWFGGKDYEGGQFEQSKLSFEYNPNTHPQDIFDKYSTNNFDLTMLDKKMAGGKIVEYEEYLMKWMLRNLTSNQEWRSGINKEEAIKEIATKKFELDRHLESIGIVPFVQRRKKEKKIRNIKTPKNPPSPPKGGQ
nr:nonstructural ORF1a polyprotein [Bat astrovirus BtSY5]